MILVRFELLVAGNGLAYRQVWLPAIPRVADTVIIEPGGWIEPVRDVEWDLNADIAAGDTWVTVVVIAADAATEEELQALRDAGWTLTEPS